MNFHYKVSYIFTIVLFVIESVTSQIYDFEPQANVFQNPSPKVNVSIYYETLCPASKRFFIRELKETVQRIPDYLNIELIPYGFSKATYASGVYTVKCHHGPSECYGNMLHSCVIDNMDKNSAVLFNACLMTNTVFNNELQYYDFSSSINMCASEMSIDVTNIIQCMSSEKSVELLRGHGEKTASLSPPFVPYIIINGSPELQWNGLDLMTTVCSLIDPMPVNCYYLYRG